MNTTRLDESRDLQSHIGFLGAHLKAMEAAFKNIALNNIISPQNDLFLMSICRRAQGNLEEIKTILGEKAGEQQ